MILVLAALLLGPASAAGDLDPAESFAARQTEFAVKRSPAEPCKTTKGARCAYWDFKSKKPAEVDSKGRKTWLRFFLKSAEHPSEAAALADFKRLSEAVSGDPYAKAPEYHRLKGRVVYSLHGACLLAGKRWKAMLAALDAELGAPSQDSVVQCGCGTGCWAGVR